MKLLMSLATGAVLAMAALLSSAGTATAAGAQLKDCGRLNVGIGGLGHPPVPGSIPGVDAFRVSGQLSCAIVHSVMQKFEKNASSTLTASQPPALGWTCKFSTKAKGYVCRKGANVIEDQFVWKLHGRIVGPKPRTP